MFLLKNAHVFAPRDAGINDLLISNDRIAAIAPGLAGLYPHIPAEDLEGCVVTPGLIDQHVHVTGGGGENGFSSRTPEVVLSDCIGAGVTTLVGLLGTDSRTRTVGNLIAKTKALKEEGITAYCLTGAYEHPSPTLTGSVADDIVYISEVLGCKIAISDHRCSHMTKQDLISLAAQVRIASLIARKPGVVHMHLGALREGLDMVLEIVRMGEIPIKHFRPTHISGCIEGGVEFANMGGYIDFSTLRTSEDSAARLLPLLERVPKQKVTVSSDANGSLPKWNQNREIIGLDVARMDTCLKLLCHLVSAQGQRLEEVLPLFTSNVAQALELYPRKGCLEEGSDADLLVLDDRMQLQGMYAKGRCMMRGGVHLEKGTFEA